MQHRASLSAPDQNLTDVHVCIEDRAGTVVVARTLAQLRPGTTDVYEATLEVPDTLGFGREVWDSAGAGFIYPKDVIQFTPPLAEVDATLLATTVAAELAPLINAGDPSGWAEVKAKLLSLGTARVTIQAPVLADGSILITRGADYRTEDGRGLGFTFESPWLQVVAPRVGQARLTLNNAETLQVLGKVDPAEGGLRFTFELTGEQTQVLSFESCPYFIDIITSDATPRELDVASGTATIRAGSE